MGLANFNMCDKKDPCSYSHIYHQPDRGNDIEGIPPSSWLPAELLTGVTRGGSRGWSHNNIYLPAKSEFEPDFFKAG